MPDRIRPQMIDDDPRIVESDERNLVTVLTVLFSRTTVPAARARPVRRVATIPDRYLIRGGDGVRLTY